MWSINSKQSSLPYQPAAPLPVFYCDYDYLCLSKGNRNAASMSLAHIEGRPKLYWTRHNTINFKTQMWLISLRFLKLTLSDSQKQCSWSKTCITGTPLPHLKEIKWESRDCFLVMQIIFNFVCTSVVGVFVFCFFPPQSRRMTLYVSGLLSLLLFVFFFYLCKWHNTLLLCSRWWKSLTFLIWWKKVLLSLAWWENLEKYNKHVIIVIATRKRVRRNSA